MLTLEVWHPFIMLPLALGGVLASWRFTVRFALRRVTYILYVTILQVMFRVSVGIIFLFEIEPNSQVLGLLGCLVVAGMWLYCLAAARSNHLRGTTAHAWLAFLPPLGLWLCLKRGGAAPGDVAGLPDRIARYVTDTGLILLAIYLTFHSNEAAYLVVRHLVP